MGKKEELKKRIKELDGKYKKKYREVETSPEYVALEKEVNAIRKEKDELSKEETEINSSITGKFLESGAFPSYSYSSGYYASSDKNIKQEVLNSIKRGLGIKNLSLLKGSDIERITKELINRETNKNRRLKEINKKWNVKNKRIEEIWKRQENLMKEARDIYREGHELERELKKIEEKEDKINELQNPKKSAYLKRWDLKEKAEKEIKDNFDEVVERVRIGVIKESILNNLKEENEQ